MRSFAVLLMLLFPAVATAQAVWPSDGVPRQVVEQRVEAERAALYACYTEHVPSASREHGDVVVVRVIAAESGKVFRVDFLESSYQSKTFEKCVRGVLTKLDFGMKTTGKTKFVQKLGFQNGLENLKFEAPTPSGGALTRESVKAAAKAHSEAIEGCYTAQLKAKPTLRGQVLVELVIDGNTGAVKSARTVKSTLQDAAVEQCLVEQVRAFRFPIPDNPGIVIVQYPFTFDSN